MPITIKVNGTTNSLIHKMSNGISTATLPDVCKTPSPGGPVPIPYPNIAQSITLSDGTSTVKGDKMMAAVKGSKFALSNGDNAGVAGGVKSNVFMKEATWILYAFTVKMDGKNACRLSDKMFHNAENAANLTGAVNPPLTVQQFEAILSDCVKKAREAVDGPTPKTEAQWKVACRKKNAQQRGKDIGKMAEDCVIDAMNKRGNGDEVSVDQSYQRDSSGLSAVGGRGDVIAGTARPDVVWHAPGVQNAVKGVYDFKAPCPPSNLPSWGSRNPFDQGELYMQIFRQTPKLVAPLCRVVSRATPLMRVAARMFGLPL